MRRHFVSGFPRALLSLSQEKSSGVEIVISSFKIGNLFGVKDPIPGGLRSHVVCKFACAGCNAYYVGETINPDIFPHACLSI